jgi:hypothetical protein
MVAPVPSSRRRKRGVIDHLQEQTAELTQLVKYGAKALREQTAETAGELKQALRGEAERVANAQKQRAAKRIHGVGWAVQKGAGLLHAGKADAVAGYVDMAAQAAEQASRYLEENDLARIAEDVGKLVRKYPAVAMSGLFLAGLALGRFVKAGEDAERPRRARRPRRGGRATRRGQKAE